MGIVFDDDEPVTCDCGCTVYSGWVTEACMTVMYRGKPKTVLYTHCDNSVCAAQALYDALNKYLDIEETQIQSANDKESEQIDREYEAKL